MSALVLGTAAVLLGAVAGSFIATVLIRWPQGRSVLAGRSRCDACDAALGPGELVPLLSWAVQRGRCRRCGARIDSRHVAVELAAAAIGLVAIIAHPLPLALVTALFGWWLLLVAALDLEHQWLPDALTLPLVPLGLAASWAGFGPPLAERALGAAIGWAVLALIAWAYLRLRGRAGMGGGDPRLMGALGAWIGIWLLPAVLLGAGLVGLAAVAAMRLRGETVTATSRLPLGTLLALAAWPVWLVGALT
ncbi:MAG TPA: A24 family peptidase [Allosphingosinicella sp.]|nr:A24 family peptidase [Allosphingosinicella sp.]